MNSIKLSRVPLGAEQLSLKVAYERTGAPSATNPLEGLLDYSQLAAVARELASTGVSSHPSQRRSQARRALTDKLSSELPRQGIGRAKFKFAFKPPRPAAAVSPASVTHSNGITRVRIEGNLADAAINHGHFQAIQKMNDTGNSVESLKWVIKLDHTTGPDTQRILAAFDDPAFRTAVERVGLAGLARGDALELVIHAIQQEVQSVCIDKDLPVSKAKFSLQRPGLLEHAVAVIGETVLYRPDHRPDPLTTARTKSVSRTDADSGYQDCSNLIGLAVQP